MENKNVKEIQFRFTLKGHGIVQTDGNEQKKLLWGRKGYRDMTNNNNQGGFSKKNFYGDDEFKIKITSDCIKNSIRGGVARMTAQIDKMGDPNLSALVMSEPCNLMSGWLVPRTKILSFKKNSAVSFVDAEQTNDAIPTLETCSATDLLKQGNTSYRFDEKVGDVEYAMEHGSINLKELQFIPLDEITERQAADEVTGYALMNALAERFRNIYAPDYYINIDNSLGEYIAEKGILLDNVVVNDIVRYFFTGLRKFNIKKRNSFVEIDKLEICFLENPFDEKQWIEISNLNDVQNIKFEMQSYYTPVPEDKSEHFNIYRNKFNVVKEEMKQKQEDAKAKN